MEGESAKGITVETACCEAGARVVGFEVEDMRGQGRSNSETIMEDTGTEGVYTVGCGRCGEDVFCWKRGEDGIEELQGVSLTI